METELRVLERDAQCAWRHFVAALLTVTSKD
jgi:hypothetical protein